MERRRIVLDIVSSSSSSLGLYPGDCDSDGRSLAVTVVVVVVAFLVVVVVVGGAGGRAVAASAAIPAALLAVRGGAAWGLLLGQAFSFPKLCTAILKPHLEKRLVHNLRASPAYIGTRRGVSPPLPRFPKTTPTPHSIPQRSTLCSN